MKVSIKHRFTKTEAVGRVKRALERARGQLAAHGASLTEKWDDTVLTFDFAGQGQTISGTLTITDTAFDLCAKLPLALRLFEGRIEKMVQEAAAKALA